MYLSFRSSTLKFENDTSRIPKILFWVGSHEVLNAFLSRVALWNNFHVALQVEQFKTVFYWLELFAFVMWNYSKPLSIGLCEIWN